jgi:DsbC/DsbD-like thiol-disulfide interchange protein
MRKLHSLAAFIGSFLMIGALAGVSAPGDDGNPFNRPDPADMARTGNQLVPVRLVADTATIAPGQMFHLAVLFDIEPRWHIYWRNPGDSGSPTFVEVSAPDGFEVGPTLYPRPQRLVSGDEVTYGYEKRAVLFVPITAPKDLPHGDASFTVRADWLVCKGICKLGTATKSISIPTGGQQRIVLAPDVRELLDTHCARLPEPVRDNHTLALSVQPDRIMIAGPAGKLDDIEFFPGSVPGVSFTDVNLSIRDGRFKASLTYIIEPQNMLDPNDPLAVTGLIVLGDEPDDPAYWIDLPIEKPAKN